jgi:hypothetical protein
VPERQPQFDELERLLRQAGIVQANSARIVEELEDHYRDLCAEALEDGYDEQRARDMALSALGAPADIAAVASQYRELLSVSRRYPLIAELACGLISVVSAPALPVHYCAQRRESIARWGASVGLAAVITAGLLLSLQTMLGII